MAEILIILVSLAGLAGIVIWSHATLADRIAAVRETVARQDKLLGDTTRHHYELERRFDEKKNEPRTREPETGHQKG